MSWYLDGLSASPSSQRQLAYETLEVQDLFHQITWTLLNRCQWKNLLKPGPPPSTHIYEHLCHTSENPLVEYVQLYITRDCTYADIGLLDARWAVKP